MFVLFIIITFLYLQRASCEIRVLRGSISDKVFSFERNLSINASENDTLLKDDFECKNETFYFIGNETQQGRCTSMEKENELFTNYLSLNLTTLETLVKIEVWNYKSGYGYWTLLQETYWSYRNNKMVLSKNISWEGQLLRVAYTLNETNMQKVIKFTGSRIYPLKNIWFTKEKTQENYPISEESLSLNTILCIAVPVSLLAVLLLVLSFIIRCRRKKTSQKRTAEESGTEDIKTTDQEYTAICNSYCKESKYETIRNQPMNDRCFHQIENESDWEPAKPSNLTSNFYENTQEMNNARNLVDSSTNETFYENSGYLNTPVRIQESVNDKPYLDGRYISNSTDYEIPFTINPISKCAIISEKLMKIKT